MKQNLIEFYMSVAKEAAKLSYCKRNQVGAVIVKNNNILSFSYNGTPSGFNNICEDDEGNTLPSVLHAESNAILKAAKYGFSIDESVLFTSLSPCIECAKLILQSGIKEVYFADHYRNSNGIALLEQKLIRCFIIA